jgi:hypothetical protein
MPAAANTFWEDFCCEHEPVAPAVWQLGRLPYRFPGRFKLVTATIVAVALLALIVALPH